jgi:acyl-CoA thioesterase-1
MREVLSVISKRFLVILVCILPVTAHARVVLVLGDSLSAGYGIDTQKGWVALLQSRLRDNGLPHRVVNSSISGDTTSGALARLPRALSLHHPAIVIVELGGNDGLRGLSLQEMRENLAQIIRTVRDKGAKVLLLGMRLPPNYGTAYTEKFNAIYQQLAEAYGVPLVPFLLEGVANRPELMQDDGIHPRAAAQEQLLENVWPYLRPLLSVK